MEETYSYIDIGPFFDNKGDVVINPNAITEMLKTQYESVYSSPLPDKIVSSPQEFFSENVAPVQLDNVQIDREDIMDAIDQLNPNSAAGPDGVPAIVLKRCKRSLAEPLQFLFRSFLETGTIPSILKEAFVIPIHKGGARSSPANFRPVSLTSHVIKTLERVIRKSLVNHLEVNNKINPAQHGFRMNRSCLSQLLEHYDKILGFLEEGNNVDSIYLDFAKAFDGRYWSPLPQVEEDGNRWKTGCLVA